jgi:hypothetical protein
MFGEALAGSRSGIVAPLWRSPKSLALAAPPGFTLVWEGARAGFLVAIGMYRRAQCHACRAGAAGARPNAPLMAKL